LKVTTHIFIINKNDLDKKLLEKLLHSYNIAFFEELARAKQAIEKAVPTLILIDGGYGDEGFAFCKSITQNVSVPVMFLFDTAERTLITKMFGSGGCDYVLRPFNQIELTSRVYIHTSYASIKKELEDFAYYDPMTRLYNRRTFFKHAHKLLHAHQRDQVPVHLFLFHFHSLHKINETFGYFSGDRLIEEFAGIIKSVLKECSIIGRLTGNIFVAMVSHKNGKELSEYASRISRRASELSIEKEFPVVIEYVIVERSKRLQSVDDLLLEATKKLEQCEIARTKRNY